MIFTKFRPQLEGNKSFDSVFNDPGGFLYDDEGFTLDSGREKISRKWEELETALGFKRDMYTIDCICLQLYFRNGAPLELNEDMLGWHQFQVKMEQHFPQTKDWEHHVVVPAFATMLYVVYDIKNRDTETLRKRYWGD